MYVEEGGFHFCMVFQFRIVKKQFKFSNSTFLKALDLLNTEITHDNVVSIRYRQGLLSQVGQSHDDPGERALT